MKTQHLIQDNQDLLKQILQSPFIQQLAQGDLKRECFAFYLQQDHYYLHAFYQCMQAIQTHLSTPTDIDFLQHVADDALRAEQDMQTNYLQSFSDIPPAITPAPTCLAYSHYLLSYAQQASVAIALCALLPCYWVYQEVGHYLAPHNHAEHPYKKWLDLYQADDFQHISQRMTDLTNRYLSVSDQHQQTTAAQVFRQSVKYEYMFWQAAYQQESWPI